MKIIAVDDEQRMLNLLKWAVEEAEPSAELQCYTNPEEVLDVVTKGEYVPDVAFLDIEMPVLGGIELAKKLKKVLPSLNIIFATGFSEYMGEAFGVHASGYILKPVTADAVKEELANLRHEVSSPDTGIFAHTFGNFELFVNGEPVHFGRAKGKELLAYLIDRRGVTVTRKEIAATLFENSNFSRSEQVYVSNIIKDLLADLEAVGAADIILKSHANYGVNTDKFKCDMYDFLAGDAAAINQYRGEYMVQYSWGDYFKG